MKKVLFVCLGNICRSPLAQGVFESKVGELKLGDDYYADSAGTSGWHEGESAHHGSIDVARKNGVSIDKQRSRALKRNDQKEFDFFVAMDRSNADSLVHEFGIPEERVLLMRQFDDKGRSKDVPDPYGSGAAAFDNVFDILDRSMGGLIEYLEKN